MHGWSCFMRLQSGWRILEDRRDILYVKVGGCKGWRPLGLAVSGRRQGRPDRRLLPEPKSRCECCKDLSPPYDEELAQANRRRSRWTPMRHRIALCGKVGDTCAANRCAQNTVVAAGAPCARRARARRHKTGAVNRSSNPCRGCAGINRHVVGDERALQERRQRLYPDPESCGCSREVAVEA